MLFNSYIFLFGFLPLTWVVFRSLRSFRRARLSIGFLVLASLGFYSYWNPPFVLLILFSIIVNYCTGRHVHSGQRRYLLMIGVAVNLILIGYFKYSGFFMANLMTLMGTKWEIPQVFLPLGISFFTFQQIAYLVDCHRDRIQNITFIHYCLFVAFFPQLIAGPIVRHNEILPQIQSPETFRFCGRNLFHGFALLVSGLFKKVMIADTLSPWAIEVFDASAAPSCYDAWIGALAYTFQIYFDFSGYSEMALGLALLFNIRIPLNFDSPYRSLSHAEFWRRWHMTLSRFLKDYLYIPLGGNRQGSFRRYRNLMITMLLGGLWHGAAWTFVLWGGIHGIFLSLNHAWRWLRERFGLFQMPAFLAWGMTFLGTVIAWVFFRSATAGRAVEILSAMLDIRGRSSVTSGLMTTTDNVVPLLPVDEKAALLGLLLLIVVACPPAWRMAEKYTEKWPILTGAVCGALFFLSVVGLTRITEFLYFQF